MVALFNFLVYGPIYNALALLVSWVPYGDVGVAIVLLTIVVKVALFPLSVGASYTQRVMRAIEPDLKILRERHKDAPQELALKTLALYRTNRINPFSSIFVILIQLPIILGLYFVIWRESADASFDPALLYSFVALPDVATFSFLGLIPLAAGSIGIAFLVAVTQYVQARLMMPTAPTPTGKSFQDDLAASLHIQMRYVFPVVMGVVAYVATAAIGLYFLVSNIFGIMQEVAAERRFKQHEPR